MATRTLYLDCSDPSNDSIIMGHAHSSSDSSTIVALLRVSVIP